MKLPPFAAAATIRSTQRGLTLLELLISLSILGGIVVGITKLAQDAGDDTRASVTALHTRTVGDAASAYIKDNYAAISAIATATTPALIRVPDLVATGYLPAGYSVVNARLQATCVLVLEPTANRLTGLVMTEGGDTLDDLTLGQVASLIGGAGGGIYSTAPTDARGAMGGYSFPVGAYGNPNSLGQRCDGSAGNITVAAGHAVMALPYSDGAQASSTLYRDAVPGNPSLNTMNTPILMGAGSQQTIGAACTTVGAIATSATGAVLACEDGVWKQGGSAFWADPVSTAAAMPACTAALVNQTRVVQTPSVGTGPRAYTCNGGGSWLPLSVDDAGNLAVAGTATMAGLMLTTVNVENTACPANGRISRNAAGATLHCESGVWRRGVNTSGDTITGGRLDVNNESWGLVMRNGAGADNSTAQSVVGSAYVNDIYLRSTGRWASQSGGVKPSRIAAVASGGVGGGGVGAGCNSNETVTGGGGYCVSAMGYNFLYYSVPNGNGWYIACDSPNRTTFMNFVVYAVCSPL